MKHGATLYSAASRMLATHTWRYEMSIEIDGEALVVEFEGWREAEQFAAQCRKESINAVIYDDGGIDASLCRKVYVY